MEIRLCESCIHYHRYYVKKPNRLKYAGRGCCVHCRMGTRKYNQIPRIESCERFSPDKGARQCKDMKNVLRDMANSLADIALMLSADEESEES